MMNNMKLTDAQAVYLVSRMFDNADLVDICKDVNKNQEAVNKVMSMISEDVMTKMLDEIKPSVLLKASKLDNYVAKCRMILESWWTLSDITAQTIELFLQCGDFDTKQHRAWVADVFCGKKIDDQFMMNLKYIYSESLYAIMYK